MRIGTLNLTDYGESRYTSGNDDGEDYSQDYNSDYDPNYQN